MWIPKEIGRMSTRLKEGHHLIAAFKTKPHKFDRSG